MVPTVVACGDDDQPTGPVAPADFDIVVETMRDTVKVRWDAQTGVDSFKVEITSNPTFTRWVMGGNDRKLFSPAPTVLKTAPTTRQGCQHWDGANWSFVETGADMWQMLTQYFQPLADAQLQKLNQDI